MNKCLLGSNESIPRPGFLFQQKVIAKLEHLDDQEKKRKRNVEQKGQLNIKGKGKTNEMQNWIQNQF